MAHPSAEAHSSCCFRTTWSNLGRTNTEMTISGADTTGPQHPPHSLGTKTQESPWAVWIFLGTFFRESSHPGKRGSQPTLLCLSPAGHSPVLNHCHHSTFARVNWQNGKWLNAASKKKGWIKNHFALCCLLLENCLVFCYYILYLFFKAVIFLTPEPIAKTETKLNNKMRK